MMEIIPGQTYSFHLPGGRDNQEDARYPDDDRPGGRPRVFVVCDGVGGEAKGEVASNTVAQTIGDYLSSLDTSKPLTDNDIARALSEAYNALADALTDDNRGMATTMTLLCLHAGGATVAHIGDSRIYHIRPGDGILYRSNDHSLVNALVHSGNITPEEAIDHPKSNYITRCMTADANDDRQTAADVATITDVEPGDYFLLCSDGVVHCADDEALLSLLASADSDEQKMEHLALICRRSPDNSTAFLIPVISVSTDKDDEPDHANEALPAGTPTVVIDKPTGMIAEVKASKPTIIERLSSFIIDLFD